MRPASFIFVMRAPGLAGRIHCSLEPFFASGPATPSRDYPVFGSRTIGPTAVTNLGFPAGGRFYNHACFGRCRSAQLPYETLHAGIFLTETVAVHQVLQNGHHVQDLASAASVNSQWVRGRSLATRENFSRHIAQNSKINHTPEQFGAIRYIKSNKHLGQVMFDGTY
jgi:hypothetical protein